jgi:hypothetical protein
LNSTGQPGVDAFQAALAAIRRKPRARPRPFHYAVLTGNPVNTTEETTMKTSASPLRRQLLLAACTLALAVPSGQAGAGGWSWFGGDQVQGSGNIQKQARQVPHFTGVELSLPGKVEVHIGNTEGVTIETDDNLLPLIETTVEDGTLRLRPTKRNLNLRTRNLKIVVNARDIDRLTVGGSGSISTDPLRAPKLEFVIGGSGSIDVAGIDTDAAALKVAGSGDLKVGDGNVRTLSVTISGSGDVKMDRVKAASANVKVAGSGTATLWVQDSLSLTVAGSGDVNYYGDPRVTQSVAGSGSAHRLGAAPR